jgi:hypothetical protein
MAKQSFDISPKTRKWLVAPDEQPRANGVDEAFYRWLISRFSDGALRDVGGILVDQAVFETHFACRPERCTPPTASKNVRCCCMDLSIPLTSNQRQAFRLNRSELMAFLKRVQPERAARLESGWKNRNSLKNLFLERDGVTLRRLEGRCVFSRFDFRKRIRCGLHGYARSRGIALSEIQPLNCKLFPLVLVNIPVGRVLLTVLDRRNYRLWGARHPRSFPCLADQRLPRLPVSMASTLDDLFGTGFSRAISRSFSK